jgi:hypothetical protein
LDKVIAYFRNCHWERTSVQRIRTDFSQQSRDGFAGGIRIRVLADRADDPLAVDAFPIGPSLRPSKLPNIWTALPTTSMRRPVSVKPFLSSFFFFSFPEFSIEKLRARIA